MLSGVFFPHVQVQTVALIGNGPISADQQAELAGFDAVVRFNLPNHFAPERSDALTVWAVRFADTAKHNYWGLDSEHATPYIASAEVLSVMLVPYTQRTSFWAPGLSPAQHTCAQPLSC